MSEHTMLTGRCPQCGEELSIPSHLKQFSCMYCGARLDVSDLRTEEPAPAAVISDEESLAAAEYYKDHILEVISNHKGIEKQLNKRGYEPAIENYAAATEPIFTSLNQAWLAGVLSLEDAVSHFLNQLEKKWEADASWKPGKKKETLQDVDKFTVAIFLVPMIRRMALPCSDPFCQELHKQWRKRYPKSVWQIGDFDTINAGFKKRFLGMCFITTAVCMQEGKPDDCAELTAFRNFRDGYLRACEDGPQLIDAYYDIAPSIVWQIETSSDPDARYTAIRETWLEPCFRDIQAGRLSSCKERYASMVRELEKEYLN